MFILKKTHEKEVNELNRKLKLARDVHREGQELDRAIIKSLGSQVDTFRQLSESRVSEIINLNEEIDSINKSRESWIQECMKKDQELEKLGEDFSELKSHHEIVCKDNITLMKDAARIFELKRQMQDKLEMVMLANMHKINKSEVLSKLSKKDVFQILELFALM